VGFLVGFGDLFVFFYKNPSGIFWLGPIASTLKIIIDVELIFRV